MKQIFMKQNFMFLHQQAIQSMKASKLFHRSNRFASNESLNYFKLILTESVREKFKAFKQGISALKYFKLFHKMCIGSQ